MGQLVFQATLGGQVNLVGPNTASTFNLNVPAASDTLVARNTTDTLTNKTLTSPTMTAPVLGTPASGTLTNCTGLPASTGITGTLGTTNGGTGLSSFTANGVVYASSTSALTTGTALTFNGSTLSLTGAFSATGISTVGDLRITAPSAGNYNSTFQNTDTTLDFYASLSAGISKAQRWFSNGGATPNMTLDSSGNLGLGVTPSAWSLAGQKVLQVSNASLTAYTSDEATISGNAYYSSGWKYIATNYAEQYTQQSGKHIWYTAPSGTAGNAITFTQAMTLDASGNLLVGTTSNAVTNSNSVVVLPAYGQINYQHASGTSSGANYAYFAYNGSGIGSITQNGTTAVAYNTTSDHRLKTNVRPADALRFMDIEFVDFEWTDGRHDCGVIAGQLQSVYPSLVFGEVNATEIVQREVTPAVPAVLDEEGNEVTPAVEATYEEVEVPKYQQVNYTGLIGRMGAMIQKQQKALQEQQALIIQLQADVAALKGNA